MTIKEVTVEREVVETTTETETDEFTLCNGCAEVISDESDCTKFAQYTHLEQGIVQNVVHFCPGCLEGLDIDDEFNDVYTETASTDTGSETDDDSADRERTNIFDSVARLGSTLDVGSFEWIPFICIVSPVACAGMLVGWNKVDIVPPAITALIAIMFVSLLVIAIQGEYLRL